MLEPLPPRREPRLLLVDVTRTPFLYAALDPWELRGLGHLARAGPMHALAKLALQVHPSHIVVLGGALRSAMLRRTLDALGRRGIARLHLAPAPIARLLARAPTHEALRALFPELRYLAPRLVSARLLRALRVGAALLGSHSLPPRHYASGLPVRAPPRLDA